PADTPVSVDRPTPGFAGARAGCDARYRWHPPPVRSRPDSAVAPAAPPPVHPPAAPVHPPAEQGPASPPATSHLSASAPPAPLLESCPHPAPPCALHCARRQTSVRLLAGIATSSRSSSPCARASASTASKSRMPERGSRAFSQPSKTRLLSLLKSPP